jgi:hypothetical protein
MSMKLNKYLVMTGGQEVESSNLSTPTRIKSAVDSHQSAVDFFFEASWLARPAFAD